MKYVDLQKFLNLINFFSSEVKPIVIIVAAEEAKGIIKGVFALDGSIFLTPLSFPRLIVY